MSEAMVREKGLLNYAQAALLLDVSTKRVSELVRTGKLKPFDFLGRRYVSMREVGRAVSARFKSGPAAAECRQTSGRVGQGCFQNGSGSGEIGRLCGSICSRPDPGAKREKPEKSFGRFGKR